VKAAALDTLLDAADKREEAVEPEDGREEGRPVDQGSIGLDAGAVHVTSEHAGGVL
jgi:hypothetical protein